MEQLLIDFFKKSADIILSNRFNDISNLLALNSNFTSNKINDRLFQIKFQGKHNLSEKMPPLWKTNNHKLLVIEFLLNFKLTNEKYLIEQWSFDLNELPSNKNKSHGGILGMSNNSVPFQSSYKKLTTLLRSIILLSSILPLYRNYINEKSRSKLKEMFTLDHNIHFSFRFLSDWHPVIKEDSKNNIGSYSSEDLHIQNSQFSFKVNYLKNLNLLLKIIEDMPMSIMISMNPIKPHDEQDTQKKNRFLSSEHTLERKSTSDTIRNNVSTIMNDSPENLHLESHGRDGSNISPIDSIFGNSSPIGTQKPPRSYNDIARSRKSSMAVSMLSERMTVDTKRKNSVENNEMDIYLVAHEDDKFTEINFGKDVVVTNNQSPTLFNIGIEDIKLASLLDTSRKDCCNQLKLSMHNSERLEKIIQQSDDDKISNMLTLVEDLNKTLCNLRETKGRDRIHLKSKNGSKNIHNNMNKSKGVRFEILNGFVKDTKEFVNFFDDLRQFGLGLQNLPQNEFLLNSSIQNS